MLGGPHYPEFVFGHGALLPAIPLLYLPPHLPSSLQLSNKNVTCFQLCFQNIFSPWIYLLIYIILIIKNVNSL